MQCSYKCLQTHQWLLETTGQEHILEKQLLINSCSPTPQKLGPAHHRHTRCGDQQKTLGASIPAGIQGPLQKENHRKMMPLKRKLKPA